MPKNKPVEFTFHIRVKGDMSVGIPETADTVKVSLEYGMNDDEMNAELESALKETLSEFYGSDFPATVLTEKEQQAADEADRKMEERMSLLEKEMDAENAG